MSELTREQARINILEDHLGRLIKASRAYNEAVIAVGQAEHVRGLRLEELKSMANEADGWVPHQVFCGGLGCLTDDCPHWSTNCSLKIMTPCLVDRTYTRE